MMYRIDKELVAIPSDDLVEPTRHLKGHSRKFRELGSSCDTVKYSFYPRTIKQWNELSEEVVTSPTLDITMACDLSFYRKKRNTFLT